MKSQNISLLFLSILSFLDATTAALKAYQRRQRSQPIDKDEFYDSAIRCAAFDYFEVEHSPVSYDGCNSNRVRMVESLSWVEKNSTYQPDHLVHEDHTPFLVVFCFVGGTTIRVVVTDDGQPQLSILPADSVTENPFRPFRWVVQSSRYSPFTGSYIIDVQVLQVHNGKCCFLSMIDYTFTVTAEDCVNEFSCLGTPQPNQPVLTFHAVKFVSLKTYYDDDEDLKEWGGIFTLCATSDCEERVNSVIVEGEMMQLLPVVMECRFVSG